MYPTKQDIAERIGDDLPKKYLDRFEHSANYLSSGIAAVLVYLNGGGQNNTRSAFRIGGLIGANSRLVDDLSDGELVNRIHDRELFLNNYIISIHGHTPSPVEHTEEKAAYKAGHMLGEHLDAEIFTSYMGDIRDIVLNEDKSDQDYYQVYSRTAGGVIGELIGISLGELEDFDPSTKNLKFAYDLGYLGQVSDDVLDQDTGLPNEVLQRFYKESGCRIKRHGKMGYVLWFSSRFYPQLYRSMKSIARIPFLSEESFLSPLLFRAVFDTSTLFSRLWYGGRH